MHASLASGQVDICLIPEVPFNLHGPNGVLVHLKHLIETKRSAVVCVAEGAGQSLLKIPKATDAYGNIIIMKAILLPRAICHNYLRCYPYGVIIYNIFLQVLS